MLKLENRLHLPKQFYIVNTFATVQAQKLAIFHVGTFFKDAMRTNLSELLRPQSVLDHVCASNLILAEV